MVLEGKVPNLLGRDWLSWIKLKWNELFPARVHNIDTVERVEDINIQR